MTFELGDYTLSKTESGTIWITRMDPEHLGEGGTFSEAELVKVIAQFYAERL